MSVESSKVEPGSRPRSALLASGRRQIVDLLSALPLDHAGLSAGELADRLGVHVSTVRFHLERLRDAGLVTGSVAPGRTLGRPGLRYTLVEQASDQDDVHLQLLTTLLMESFRNRSDGGHLYTPEELGEHWAQLHARATIGLAEESEVPARTPGQWFAKVGRIVDLLQAWGYQPELSTRERGDVVHLQLLECPFLDLARADPGLICGIHRGLLRGAMREFGEPGSGVVLEEFTEPPLCRVQISRTSHKETA